MPPGQMQSRAEAYPRTAHGGFKAATTRLEAIGNPAEVAEGH